MKNFNGKRHLGVAGFEGATKLHWNWVPAKLYEQAIKGGEGKVAEGVALVVETGKHTGRSEQVFECR